jgi:DNA polymerase I
MSDSAGQKVLFLLDAYALVFRAYYAFIGRPMINSRGLNTSAAFGFAITLDEILRNRKPSHIAVVFDTPIPTFRHKLFPAYKANRDETPEGIKVAVPYIKKLIEAYNIPVIEMPGFEADDVIGTLAYEARDKGFTVFMMTPDKDFGQLVGDNVYMYKPKRSGNEVEIWGPKEICERYGIHSPSQVIDILALWGDAADNVPGAPGIGEKTAMQLIGQYGSIDNIYANIDKLKGRQKETLLNYKTQVELARTLVTINTKVPVEFDETALQRDPINENKLRQVLDELEFKTLSKRFLGTPATPSSSLHQTESSPVSPGAGKSPVQGSLFGSSQDQQLRVETNLSTIHTVEHTYTLVQSEIAMMELTNKLQNSSEFCFDTETTGLDTNTAGLVGMSFAIKPHEAWYVPVPEPRQEARLILEHFRNAFENLKCLKIGQNMKFDIGMLAQYGIQVKGKLFDTMLAHYLIQPEERHNMDYLSAKYLAYQPVSITELIGEKGKGQKNMRQVPIEIVCEYASEDADVTLQLKGILVKELEKESMTNLFNTLEVPLVYVLSDMERTGVKINTDALNEYAKVLKKELLIIQEEIFKLAGGEFNIASPKQLGEVLFDRLKISFEAKKTKTKQYSTSEEVLQELTDKHPVVPLILDFRSLSKLLNTYVEVLPTLINAHTGRLHTSYNQALVATGRLSSNNPNLQNIPIREERGREIRKAFIPTSEEYILLSADYSQIELRLMAHVSNDTAMIEAFLKGEDIHSATAANIYNLPLSDVTREMRSKAKTANFGIIYGISAFGLAQRLRIPRKEAEELIQGYFRSFPRVRQYMTECIVNAREKGYVETILGRRRYLPEINSSNGMIRGMAERNAINAPIQGAAADIIKLAMIHIHRELEHRKLKTKMILQVHDELVFDVYSPELELVKELVRQGMEHACDLKVPLTVEIGIGSNWLEAH